MYRSTESRSADRRGAGFSLVEIIVALGILSIVVTALLPQLIIGIKATRTAQLVTQAKTLAQGELEEMRNLPYRVAPDAGPYIDVLDRFYPGIDAPDSPPTNAPGCLSEESDFVMPSSAEVVAWEGYVADAAVPGASCPYEPQAGSFYRTTEERDDAELGRIVLITDTQFLRIMPATLQPTPVAPVDYNSGTTGLDSPPSSQIGVSLTVLYTEGQRVRASSTYTQIAQRISSPARLQARVEATAVEISSTDESEAAVSMTAGVLTLTGSLTHVSTASADLTAVSGRRASTPATVTNPDGTTGMLGDGAAITMVAPPAQTVPAPTDVPGCVDPSQNLLCWGTSSLAPGTLSLTTASALPKVGSAVAPIQTVLTGSENQGLRFDNTRPRTDGTRYRTPLRSPLVSFAAAAPGSATAGCTLRPLGYATAAGYVETTETKLDTCGQVHAGTLHLLPTTDYPSGLVEIRLEHAWARCQHGSPTPTDYGYSATVKVNGSSEGPWSISKGVANNLPAPGAITLSSGGSLGDYISSWTPFSDLPVAPISVGDDEASVSIPGVLTVLTKDVRRVDDPDAPYKPSELELTVGAVSCSVMDRR